MDWIFDGIGTEIVSLIIGLFSGGLIGYRIGIKNKVSQSQKAGNNSNQTQIGSITNHENTESRR